MKIIKIYTWVVLLFLLITSCSEDNSLFNRIDCEDIYPIYGSVIENYEPIFIWCKDEKSDAYRFQLSTDINFDKLLFDTTSNINELTPHYFVQDLYDTTLFWGATLNWGTNYYWRIAKIKDNKQKKWSDTYHFQTYDFREDVIGTYQVEKRRYIDYQHPFMNQVYIEDSIWAITELRIEKVPDSRGIRIKDIGSNDFEMIFGIATDYHIWRNNGTASKAAFRIDTDSFSVFHTPYDIEPIVGFVYTGRE